MTLEEVKKELLRKAREDAQKIIREGEREKKNIFEKINEKVKKRKEIIDKDTRDLKETLEKKEIATTELNAAKALLEEKKKKIDEVFNKVKEKLASQSKSERKQIIDKLLKKSSEEIDIARIYCNENDKSFINSNKYIKSDISGGLIAENNDKSIRVDYSYEVLLNTIKEEKLSEISKILFV